MTWLYDMTMFTERPPQPQQAAHCSCVQCPDSGSFSVSPIYPFCTLTCLHDYQSVILLFNGLLKTNLKNHLVLSFLWNSFIVLGKILDLDYFCLHFDKILRLLIDICATHFRHRLRGDKRWKRERGFISLFCY